MTPGDKEALERLCARLDHVAATSKLLADHGSVTGDVADAIRGVGETLDELAQRMDGILNPNARQR